MSKRTHEGKPAPAVEAAHAVEAANAENEYSDDEIVSILPSAKRQRHEREGQERPSIATAQLRNPPIFTPVSLSSHVSPSASHEAPISLRPVSGAGGGAAAVPSQQELVDTLTANMAKASTGTTHKGGRPHRKTKGYRKSKRTRKRVPWAGWAKQSPSTRQRTQMLKKCGKKCFLGPKKTFPICRKNTCKRSRQGIYAAYVRAREYASKTHKRKYKRIASRAKKCLSTY